MEVRTDFLRVAMKDRVEKALPRNHRQLVGSLLADLKWLSFSAAVHMNAVFAAQSLAHLFEAVVQVQRRLLALAEIPHRLASLIHNGTDLGIGVVDQVHARIVVFAFATL